MDWWGCINQDFLASVRKHKLAMHSSVTGAYADRDWFQAKWMPGWWAEACHYRFCYAILYSLEFEMMRCKVFMNVALNSCVWYAVKAWMPCEGFFSPMIKIHFLIKTNTVSVHWTVVAFHSQSGPSQITSSFLSLYVFTTVLWINALIIE